MARHSVFGAISVFLCSSLLPAQQGAAPNGDVLVAVAGQSAIRVDGMLSEPAWQDAGPGALLSQQSPRPGAPTPYRTSVRVLVTKDTLFFGFECADPEPSRISVHTRQRDASLRGDDTLAIVLDTYGDRRTGYFFQINAAGARTDGLISGPESAGTDWDGVWDAATARTGTGWSAEIAIPTLTLNFSSGLTRWGLNVERQVARDRTTLRWRAATLDATLYDLSRAGTLEGLGELKQGMGVEVSPYALGRTKNFFQAEGRKYQRTVGADVTYRVTPQMAAVFTANTDFAETEVDSRQLNLTRFPLFFPERRAFFLEGSNQYEFGLGLNSNFIPFFSRRIGLFAGEQIPISAGFKLNGRAGRWNVGMLDVQTRETVLRADGSTVPGANQFAGRVSYDFNPKLRVGTLVTHGHPSGIRDNTLAGFDAVWRTPAFLGDKNFLAGAWGAFSAGDVGRGARGGWGFKIDYPNDLWDCFAAYNRFGEHLDPGLGFLPRPGTRRLEFSCDYRPRPSKTGPFRWVRQQFMEHDFYRVTNARGQTESWRFFWAPVNIQLETGDRLEFNWAPEYQFLPEPFAIGQGVVLPVGSYRFDRFRFEFQTSRHRPWEFGTTTWFGTFYNGRLLQQSNYLRFTMPGGAWQAGLNTQQNFGKLTQGNFVQRLWQLNAVYAFSPDLALTTFLQYDTDSKSLGNNLRLRWTLKPGNDLFIVWNRSWKRLILDRDDLTLLPDTELLAVKLRWTFRR